MCVAAAAPVAGLVGVALAEQLPVGTRPVVVLAEQQPVVALAE